jgi:preprotein translocase subunit SecD
MKRRFERLNGNRPGHNVHITTRMPSQQFEDIEAFYDSTSSDINGENIDETGAGNVSSTLTLKIEEKIEKVKKIVINMEKKKRDDIKNKDKVITKLITDEIDETFDYLADELGTNRSALLRAIFLNLDKENKILQYASDKLGMSIEEMLNEIGKGEN